MLLYGVMIVRYNSSTDLIQAKNATCWYTCIYYSTKILGNYHVSQRRSVQYYCMILPALLLTQSECKL